LAVVVAAAVVAAVVFHGLPVLVVVLALVAMVMIHELGHFVAAKLSGMKVTEYFLGFGPRIWSVRKGETQYGVKAIPAGGYVRIVGMTMLEEVEPEDEARSYRQASFPRRLFVAVAGSAMHFVMALVLLWALLSFAGLPVAATPQVTGLTTFASGRSPAERAGLEVGDQFVSIDGRSFASGEGYIAFIKSHAGDDLALVVRRGTHDVALHVRPEAAAQVKVVEGRKVISAVSTGDKAGDGVIGVSLDFLSRNETISPLVAVGRAGTMLGSVTAETATGMAQVFSLHGLSSFAHQVTTAGSSSSTASSSTASSSPAASSSSGSSGQLLSILGAVEIGAQAARQDVSELLYILVAINIFVGMINLFPMLPLDGGHVAIAVYERIRSRSGRAYHANVAKLMPVAYAFLLFMVVLGVGALYANIVQPVSLPGG
jgi:membrane-associated protease RseP (regulator of RpoE activity)